MADGIKRSSGQADWEFHTNSLGTADLNIKPPTHQTSGTFHQVGAIRTSSDFTGNGTSTVLGLANPFTAGEKSKLSGIQAGAEQNVKSDYLATTGDAQILNLPRIPTTLNDMTDVVVSSPKQGETLIYDRGTGDYTNRILDNPTHTYIDVEMTNISATSGDHKLLDYTWSDLQLTTIELAVGYMVGFKLIITTDQPWHSVKFRQTGSTGSFIGSTALPGIVSGTQTVTGKGLVSAQLEPTLDVYLNRSTSTRATITRARLFLLLYIP